MSDREEYFLYAIGKPNPKDTRDHYTTPTHQHPLLLTEYEAEKIENCTSGMISLEKKKHD